MSLRFHNKLGHEQELVLGYDDPTHYSKPPYTEYNYCLGASIGRYAGRISKGGFDLDGQFYPLSTEEGVHLHGGEVGFDKQLWYIKEEHHGDTPYVIFQLNSPHMEGGYPGNVVVEVLYQLSEDSLNITYTAKSDRNTVLNLTNHAYFHLDDNGSVEGNYLFINSNSILDVADNLIPSGLFQTVKGTPYDYRSPISLQFDRHHGLDTAFKVEKDNIMASLYSETSGIQMEVESNQSCVVVYTPYNLPKMGIRNEDRYKGFPAICFECQNFPDAPNHQNFPSAILRSDETYRNETRYRFTLP